MLFPPEIETSPVPTDGATITQPLSPPSGNFYFHGIAARRRSSYATRRLRDGSGNDRGDASTILWSAAIGQRLLADGHALRTPLIAIIGFSEMINRELLGNLRPPIYGEYIAHIHDSSVQQPQPSAPHA